jgi:hypothetical protein
MDPEKKTWEYRLDILTWKQYVVYDKDETKWVHTETIPRFQEMETTTINEERITDDNKTEKTNTKNHGCNLKANFGYGGASLSGGASTSDAKTVSETQDKQSEKTETTTNTIKRTAQDYDQKVWMIHYHGILMPMNKPITQRNSDITITLPSHEDPPTISEGDKKPNAYKYKNWVPKPAKDDMQSESDSKKTVNSGHENKI